MTALSVNINKVALIRNARGGSIPNVVQVAKDCVSFGADGITVHPRPDQRHIRYQDVRDLKEALSVELNVEGYPSEAFLSLMQEVRPSQCTLVPDPPDVLTSDTGWDTGKHKHFLLAIIQRLQALGIRTSLFVDTSFDSLEHARDIGTDRIELYTGPYAEAYTEGNTALIEAYSRAGEYATELGMGVNAGHDLNLDNLETFHSNLPFLEEVSIGHALISDALYLGLKETIHQYQSCLGKKIQASA
ncbi:MAG: pyridoxine 5'-phosphate synthase [Bacteroidota bacterium]